MQATTLFIDYIVRKYLMTKSEINDYRKPCTVILHCITTSQVGKNLQSLVGPWLLWLPHSIGPWPLWLPLSITRGTMVSAAPSVNHSWDHGLCGSLCQSLMRPWLLWLPHSIGPWPLWLPLSITRGTMASVAPSVNHLWDHGFSGSLCQSLMGPWPLWLPLSITRETMVSVAPSVNHSWDHGICGSLCQSLMGTWLQWLHLTITRETMVSVAPQNLLDSNCLCYKQPIIIHSFLFVNSSSTHISKVCKFRAPPYYYFIHRIKLFLNSEQVRKQQ